MRRNTPVKTPPAGHSPSDRQSHRSDKSQVRKSPEARVASRRFGATVSENVIGAFWKALLSRALSAGRMIPTGLQVGRACSAGAAASVSRPDGLREQREQPPGRVLPTGRRWANSG